MDDLPGLTLPISKEEYDKVMDGEKFHHHFHPFNDHRIFEVYVCHSQKVSEEEMISKAPHGTCIGLKGVPMEHVDWEKLDQGMACSFPVTIQGKQFRLSIASKKVVEEETSHVCHR